MGLYDFKKRMWTVLTVENPLEFPRGKIMCLDAIMEPLVESSVLLTTGVQCPNDVFDDNLTRQDVLLCIQQREAILAVRIAIHGPEWWNANSYCCIWDRLERQSCAPYIHVPSSWFSPDIIQLDERLFLSIERNSYRTRHHIADTVAMIDFRVDFESMKISSASTMHSSFHQHAGCYPGMVTFLPFRNSILVLARDHDRYSAPRDFVQEYSIDSHTWKSTLITPPINIDITKLLGDFKSCSMTTTFNGTRLHFIDSISNKHWMITFGRSREELITVVAYLSRTCGLGRLVPQEIMTLITHSCHVDSRLLSWVYTDVNRSCTI